MEQKNKVSSRLPNILRKVLQESKKATSFFDSEYEILKKYPFFPLIPAQLKNAKAKFDSVTSEDFKIDVDFVFNKEKANKTVSLQQKVLEEGEATDEEFIGKKRGRESADYKSTRQIHEKSPVSLNCKVILTEKGAENVLISFNLYFYETLNVFTVGVEGDFTTEEVFSGLFEPVLDFYLERKASRYMSKVLSRTCCFKQRIRAVLQCFLQFLH